MSAILKKILRVYRDSLGSAMLCGASWESSFVAYERCVNSIMCRLFYTRFWIFPLPPAASLSCSAKKRGSHKVCDEISSFSSFDTLREHTIGIEKKEIRRCRTFILVAT